MFSRYLIRVRCDCRFGQSYLLHACNNCTVFSATLSVHWFTMHWYSQVTSTFMSTVCVCFFCTIISKDGFQVISSFIVLIYGLLARVMCSFPTVAETISRPLVVGLHRYKTSWETFICYLIKQKALPEKNVCFLVTQQNRLQLDSQICCQEFGRTVFGVSNLRYIYMIYILYNTYML